MKFNGVELMDETIINTRQWFANNAIACIEEVDSGKIKVNDYESYVSWRREQAEKSLKGENDYTFTFLQRAYFIQTRECVALLP